MPDVSIIIVNWNTRDLLASCLDSITQTAGDLEVEIIVVDNASTDSSQAMVRERQPQVYLIENDRNVGFARANNRALATARGRYSLLLNSDTIVLPGTLETMVRFADLHPDAGIIGCKLLNRDGSLQESWASFPTLKSEILGQNVRKWQAVADTPNAYIVDWVGGACMLVRSVTVDEVGPLDEDFFMYSEETDWCYRVRQKDWLIYYLTSAGVVHLGGGSASRASAEQLLRLYESKIRFFHKHYDPTQAMLLRFGLVAANLSGLIRRALQCNEQEALSARWTLIRGLLRV